MIKFILLTIAFIGLSGCSHMMVNFDEDIPVMKKQKMDINDYTYLESSTGISNSGKAVQEQLSKKEKTAAIKRLNAAHDIAYNESTEEQIEKKAAGFIAEGKWKSALDALIKYEPVLTHNKNLTNQIIYVSLRLDYYDFAIDQLKLALNQTDEVRSFNQIRRDKEIILAHVYYLSEKYDEAKFLYSKLLEHDHYSEAAKYLFLIGYKQKDLDTMNQYLSDLGESHPDYIDYTILAANVEMEKGMVEEARDRLHDQFERHPDHQDLVFKYANALIEMQQYKDALAVLNQGEARVSDTRQYHFMQAYIHHKSGNRDKFHDQLAQANIENRYQKLLTQLLLQKQTYSFVYGAIFQENQIDQYKFTNLVKESAEKFTLKHINQSEFKDAVLVREEYRSVTEPIRLPASLEFVPKK